MKTIASAGVFLAALLTLVLGMSPARAADKQGRVFTVGFAQDNMANDWRAAQVRAVADALAAHPNIRFIHTDAKGSVAKNVLDVEDLIDRGVDLLMASPRDPAAMSPVLSKAYQDGIPVVLLTRRMIGDDYTAFVSPDDAAIAAQAAEQVAKALKGKGKVLVLQGVPTASTAIKRTEGFLSAIKAHAGIDIVAVKPANYLRANAIKVIQAMLEKGEKFDAIYAQSDSMASGARVALEAAGIDPVSVPIVGIDYIPEARDAIRAGTQAASFTYPTCGKEAAALAVRILNGERVPRQVEVPSVMVIRDNVDAVETIF
jgi:ribose transport system substrate-binding protein